MRWTALGFGVLYGFSHQRTIYKHNKVEEAKREYERKQILIAQAKAEWARIHPPPPSTDNIIRDPEDPRFSLETFLTDYAAKNP